MRWKGGAHQAPANQGAVTHEPGDPAVVLGDLGLDEVLARRPQALVGSRLVDRHESAVADDVRSQDRGEPARHQFGPTPPRKRMIGPNGQQNQSQGLRPSLGQSDPSRLPRRRYGDVSSWATGRTLDLAVTMTNASVSGHWRRLPRITPNEPVPSAAFESEAQSAMRSRYGSARARA